MTKPRHAFTIVELIIIIVLIGLLGMIATSGYKSVLADSRDAQRSTNVKALAAALEKYYEKNGEYPGCSTMTSANLVSLSTKLDNISQNTFTMPDNEKDTNAIICADISTNSEDVIAYKTSESTSCRSGDSCLYFTLQYREESSGTIKIIKSRHAITSFAKTWGTDGYDLATSVAQTSDGGIAIVGCTDDCDDGYGDAFITKYNSAGKISWSRTWGGSDHDQAYSIIQTSDGNLVIAGETISYGSGSIDAFVAKYTNTGDLLWSRTWGGIGYDGARYLTQSNDGNIVVTGDTSSYGTGSHDAYIAKYDTNGNLLWSRTWGGTASDYSSSITSTSDGGIAIVGITYSYDIENGDGFIAKYNINGELSWSRTWGGTGYDCASSIIQTEDNGLALTGCTNSFSGSEYNAFITKFTINGDLSWSRTWGGTANDYGNSIAKTIDGGILVVGGTFSYGAGNEDVFIAKYSASGALDWSKTFGSTYMDNAYFVTQIYDESLLVVGETDSFDSNRSDSLIIKYQPDGIIEKCSTSLCQDISASNGTLSVSPSSPIVTATSPTATTTSPTVVNNSITPISKNIINSNSVAYPTISFNSNEMYISYPGDNQTSCKQWTVPVGNLVYGLYYNQASELGYDFFSITIDGNEVYNQSGSYTDQFLDLSSSPGSIVRACLSADESVQDGFGAEITGIYYVEQ